MTHPLDEKAIAQAHEAYAKTTGGLLDGNPMVNAIRAYLSTVALPDELEVAIKRAIARLQNLHDYAGSPTWERVLEEELRAIFSQAHSTIAALRAERDEALAEIERMTPKFVAYEYLESPAGRLEAEAEVKRLTEAAARIKPYLVWTIGDESPGHHPTMPSAVDAFLAALNSREKAE